MISLAIKIKNYRNDIMDFCCQILVGFLPLPRHFCQDSSFYYKQATLEALVRVLTLFRMGLLGAAHGWVGSKKSPLTKICHTYPTMMKLGTIIPYLNKIKKIYESRDTLLQHFFTGNQQILLYQEIQV